MADQNSSHNEQWRAGEFDPPNHFDDFDVYRDGDHLGPEFNHYKHLYLNRNNADEQAKEKARTVRPAGDQPVELPAPRTNNDLPDEERTAVNQYRKDVAEGRIASAPSPCAAELARLKTKLETAIQQYEDFPEPGILFEDIMPLFANVDLHNSLLRAMQIMVLDVDFADELNPKGIEVVVGLEARGFLIGPSLALKCNCGFVPVRKKGKLPGRCEIERYVKEYGEDYFEMQYNSIKPGQKCIILDDVVATGGSALAAAELITKQGGILIGFFFLMELAKLGARTKLELVAPVHTLFDTQTKADYGK